MRRIHEWLADHVSWVQYPRPKVWSLERPIRRSAGRPLNMFEKAFYGLSIIGAAGVYAAILAIIAFMWVVLYHAI